MDALQELINKTFDERLKQTDCVASIPCYVVDVLNNGYYIVEDIKSGNRYTVPNYSGSAVNKNENVQLFFKGGVITNKAAYIGAVNYKNTDSASPVIIYGLNNLGELIDSDVVISSFRFKAIQSTNLFISFNANIFGTSIGEIALKVVVGQNELIYKPRKTISLNEYNLICFSLPFSVESGEYMVYVIANGVGNFVDICSYICGVYIEALPIYDPTSDSDYIHEIQDEKANSIFYVGSSLKPSIPTTLSNKSINIIRATTFNTSDVLGVYIPEGITEIE